MSDMPSILYVEDDETLRFITAENLERKGYEVITCADGLEGLTCFKDKLPDICLLDVMLPKMDGFSLAKEIRSGNQDVPIIFLTAKTMKEDRIEGLVLGADDYMIKPFSVEELILRIEVFLRRSKVSNSNIIAQKLSVADIQLDMQNLILSLPDGEQKLTPREADLLAFFIRHKNELLTREAILEAIWGDNDYFFGRSLDVFISKIRKMLKADSTIKLENRHGVGFILKIKA
ncbi:MAG: response regulator transcription factor [Bacteroidetes bacterium]|jgi:DNA-binding response OmpR family regulator|nr:response regulator transcription factor [Bacteroidota bacterium]MBT4411940.1 response regulator transcription factor [Bacteroidota bacterium]MBT5425732.1 response regulator transcription factor [Bacteroidota bacterium]